MGRATLPGFVVVFACACAVACGGASKPAPTRPTQLGSGSRVASPDSDDDRDGILRADDRCPSKAEDLDGYQDADGCPDPDNDGDRVLDVDDDCPNDPETYNGAEDGDGCPDRGHIYGPETELGIAEQVHFGMDSAEILPRSHPLLDAVAAALLGNPQITLVEIQGHADPRGSDAHNLALTANRAAAVRQALVERGVEDARLRSVGYGSRCPIDPRDDARASERNRRVEFKILETTEGPTGTPLICSAGRDLAPK